jgi:pyruvate dehydrogenase E1 component alpha subunit
VAKAKQAQSKLPVSPEKLAEYYEKMLYIRRFEEKCNFAYRQGKVGGYMHVYIGMEATAMGWIDSIKVGHDYVITAYRAHAMPLLMGTDPVQCMAEIMGRSGGTSRGKGGSMHLYDLERGFYGGWGIVGGHVPIGTGLAFASKYRDEDRVTLNFFGDGAANQGVVFESMNMAALYELPCIFLVENNEFAMGTRLEYHAPDTELHKRGMPFGMKHERLDGMDVMQVKEDAERIVNWVRENQKPYFVEVMNYRFAGHGAADNDRQLYRTKEEEEEAQNRDPISRLEKILLENDIKTQKDLDSLDEKTQEEVNKVYQEADDSPFPDFDTLGEDVYTDMTPELDH